MRESVNDAPIHTLVETSAFTARAKKLGLSADELASIYDIYATTPDYGKVIRNTGGLRKGRVAKDHGGQKRRIPRVQLFCRPPKPGVSILAAGQE